MRTFELWFYKTMLWFAQYELAIARSTGRNPANTASLSVYVSQISSHINRLEINK